MKFKHSNLKLKFLFLKVSIICHLKKKQKYGTIQPQCLKKRGDGKMNETKGRIIIKMAKKEITICLFTST